MEVSVGQVERDIPCRAWEITLKLSKDGEEGYYLFHITDAQWEEAKSNPLPETWDERVPQLVVDNRVAAG